MRPRRFCRIWTCEQLGLRLCCADCWLREACPERCLNWPNRCRCTVRPEERGGSRETDVPRE